jgi:hypothetical protein
MRQLEGEIRNISSRNSPHGARAAGIITPRDRLVMAERKVDWQRKNSFFKEVTATQTSKSIGFEECTQTTFENGGLGR